MPSQNRDFESRTMRYADVKDIMEEAKPMILEKAQQSASRTGFLPLHGYRKLRPA